MDTCNGGRYQEHDNTHNMKTKRAVQINMSWAASAALNTLPCERACSLKEAFAVYLFKERSTRRASLQIPTRLVLAMALAHGEWSPKQPTPCKETLAVHRFKLLTENARRRPWPVTSDHATADVNRPEQSTHSQRRPTGGRAARAARGRGRHGNLPT